MSKSINIFSKALEYYDINKEKYIEFNNKINFIKFKKGKNDYDHNIIEFYDVEKKKIHSSRYEILGSFNNSSRNWIWAWSDTRLNPNTIFLSKKILNYGLDLESNSDNMFIKNELITGEFIINNNLQLDLHVSIASYLSKKPFIFYYKITKKIDDDLININNKDNNEKNFIEYYLFILDFENLI
jgi:hypothetical protein